MTITWDTMYVVTKMQQLLLGAAGVIVLVAIALFLGNRDVQLNLRGQLAGVIEPKGACYSGARPGLTAISYKCDQLTQAECNKANAYDGKNVGFWRPGECDKEFFVVSQVVEFQCRPGDETLHLEENAECIENLRKMAELTECKGKGKNFRAYVMDSPRTFFEFTPGPPPMCAVHCAGLYVCLDPRTIASVTPAPTQSPTYPVSTLSPPASRY